MTIYFIELYHFTKKTENWFEETVTALYWEFIMPFSENCTTGWKEIEIYGLIYATNESS